MPDAILRLPQVRIRVGLSRSSIYAAIAEGRFPPSIRLGARAVGWLESDVTRWLQQQVDKSRAQQ
jgi:prophage regulatory protein